MNVHQSNLMRGMMLIGGKMVPSEADEWIESLNPANEENARRCPAGDGSDVNHAVAAAETAQPAWAASSRRSAENISSRWPKRVASAARFCASR